VSQECDNSLTRVLYSEQGDIPSATSVLQGLVCTRVEELDEMIGAFQQMRATQVRAVLSVTVVFYGCCKSVTRVSRESYKSATRVLQER
jgi:hypothetical protein